MQYFIIIEPSTRKKLDKLPKKDQEKIKKVLESIKSSPFIGKKLSGELAGLYSVRAWPHRIMYAVIKKELIVLVIDVGHRKEVYKK
jgi:mRNA interferase RelE/StbE